MIGKDSRYREVVPFDPPSDGRPHFRGVRPRDIAPLTPVLEHELTPWDRADRLSQHYYSEPQKWWLVLDANPDLRSAAELGAEATAGQIVLIPRDGSEER